MQTVTLSKENRQPQWETSSRQYAGGTYQGILRWNRLSWARSHRRIVSEPEVRSRPENEVSKGKSKCRISLPSLFGGAYFNKSRATPGSSFEMSEMTPAEPRMVKMADGSGNPLTAVLPQNSEPPRTPLPDSVPNDDRSKPGNDPLQIPTLQVFQKSSRVQDSTMSDGPTIKASPKSSKPRPLVPPPLWPHMPLQQDISPLHLRRHGVASFDRDWEKIKRLCNEVWGLRSRIHEMRKDLKEKQLAKAIADDRYFQFLRIHGTPSNSPENIITISGSLMAQLFYECELARNIYGPLEDDCTLLENYLGSKELELQRLEETYYSREPEHSRLYPFQVDTIDSPQPSSTSSMGSEFNMNMHPVLSQYFSKLGDVQIWRERLDDFVEQRYILEEEQETRATVGRVLAESDQDWLRNYTKAENAMIEEFEMAEIAANNLRQQCLNLGLIDEDGTPTNLETQEHYTFADDDLDSGSEISEYMKFPHLIPRPNGKNLEIQDSGHDYDEGSEISNERISVWLLNRLRTSALEVNLLANIFETACGKIKHGEKWQVDVLAFWFDDPVGSELKARNPSSESFIPDPQHIPLPPSLESDISSKRSLGIFIKSSSFQPSDSNSKSDKTQEKYSVLLPVLPAKHQFLSKSI